MDELTNYRKYLYRSATDNKSPNVLAWVIFESILLCLSITMSHTYSFINFSTRAPHIQLSSNRCSGRHNRHSAQLGNPSQHDRWAETAAPCFTSHFSTFTLRRAPFICCNVDNSSFWGHTQEETFLVHRSIPSNKGGNHTPAFIQFL